MSAAFEATVSMGNYELAAYVWLLDLAARIPSKYAPNWGVLIGRYNAISQLAPTTFKLLIHTPLQWAENWLQYPARQGEPWELQGSFISMADVEAVGALLLHVGAWQSYALRLALFYDAPLSTLESLLAAGTKYAISMGETVVGIEWAFLAAIVQIRLGRDAEALQPNYSLLQRFSQCPDFALRVRFLDTLQNLGHQGMGAISQAEQTISELDKIKYYSLSGKSTFRMCLITGLLNFYIGDKILKETGSTKLAAGFLRDAYEAYKLDHATGVCQWMSKTYPTVCPLTEPEKVLPSKLFDTASHSARPGGSSLRRPSTSVSNDTSLALRASTSSGPSQQDIASGDGQLDTLT